MPFINSMITESISEDKKEFLKEQLGMLITELPGKSEEWLFITFNDNQSLYFKGKKKEKAAVIEVKLFGTQERADKERFTYKICKLFEDELAISGNDIYVIFTEVENGNWGWNGSLF